MYSLQIVLILLISMVGVMPDKLVTIIFTLTFFISGTILAALIDLREHICNVGLLTQEHITLTGLVLDRLWYLD